MGVLAGHVCVMQSFSLWKAVACGAPNQSEGGSESECERESASESESESESERVSERECKARTMCGA